MQSLAAVFVATILLITLLLGALLLSPIRMAIETSKRGELLAGCLRLSWLGVTIKRSDLPPQTAEELVASLAGKAEEGGLEVDEAQDGESDLDWIEDQATDRSQGREGGSKKKNKTKSRGPARIRPQRLIRAAPQLARIFYDLLSSIVFRISGRVLLGLDDPAETAILSGQVWALSSALGRSSSQLCIDPYFEGERLEGEVFVEVQVRLVWALAAMLQALRIKEVRQTGMEMLGWN